MPEKYLQEKLRLQEYLQIKGISYKQKTKTWRCPNHDDQNESAHLYNNHDGDILYCPVCNESWNIFAICSIIDRIPNDKDHFPELLNNIRHALGMPIETEKPKERKSEKKNLFHFQPMTVRKKVLKMILET